MFSNMFGYFLNLSDFRVAKSMETSGYGMVAQESRNDSHILLLHLEMYLEHLINIYVAIQ